MTNIQAKANELPEDLIDLFRPLYREISDLCRKGHNLNGRKISQSDAWNILGKARQIAFEYKEKSLSSLSGEGEAEEVLKPYLWEGFDGSSVMNVEQVIEVMQTFAASRVAKEREAVENERNMFNEEMKSVRQALNDTIEERNNLKDKLDDIMDAIENGAALKEAIKPLFDENPEVQGDSETIDKKCNHKWIRGYMSYKCEICGEFANTGIDNL